MGPQEEPGAFLEEDAEGIDEWLESATPDEREVGICLDRALVSRLGQAEERLAELRKGSKGSKMLGAEEEPALQAEVDQLREAVKAKTRVLLFKGIGYGPWRELIAKHPPDDQQDELFELAVRKAWLPNAIRALAFDAETFVPAAVSASCPELKPQQVRTLLRKAPTGVVDRIWAAVLEVNHGGAADPFANGLGARSSDPAPATEQR